MSHARSSKRKSPDTEPLKQQNQTTTTSNAAQKEPADFKLNPTLCFYFIESERAQTVTIIGYLFFALRELNQQVKISPLEALHKPNQSVYLYSSDGKVIFGFDCNEKKSAYFTELSSDKFRDLIKDLPAKMTNIQSDVKAYLSHLPFIEAQEIQMEKQNKYAVSKRLYKSENQKSVPTFKETTDYASIICQSLSNNQGIIFFHTHDHRASYEFLIEHMSLFLSKGIKHLYMEFPRDDLYQAFNHFNHTGDLNHFETEVERAGGQFDDAEYKSSSLALLKAANTAGIKIFPIDMTSFYDKNGDIDIPERLTISDDIMVRNIEEYNRTLQFMNGERYIGLLGQAHYGVCSAHNLDIPSFALVDSNDLTDSHSTYKNLSAQSLSRLAKDVYYSGLLENFDVTTVLPPRHFKITLQTQPLSDPLFSSIYSFFNNPKTIEVNAKSMDQSPLTIVRTVMDYM